MHLSKACFSSQTPLTVSAMFSLKKLQSPHAPHLDSVLILSSSLPCPSPRLWLGTVIVLAMPLTSSLSWYCHRPRHAPHLDSVLVLSSSSPCPSPRLCLSTVIVLFPETTSPWLAPLFYKYHVS
jgi:hypothetical protein